MWIRALPVNRVYHVIKLKLNYSKKTLLVTQTAKIFLVDFSLFKTTENHDYVSEKSGLKKIVKIK